MSISNKKKQECCGCNACAEICPKRCIHMEEDVKGFFYPQVDMSECIECGMCEKVCTFDVANLSLRQPLRAYAAWNKNSKEHLTSSSGGVAHVLSSFILSMGGVVYGCAADGINIRHIRIDKVTNLYRLQGSKYVQSTVFGIFRQVKNDLKANRTVLFIGTPCQVAGLKNYIGHIPEHLYLVDLICHGVPSQKMLCDHVNHVAKGIEIRQILFRKGNDIIVSLVGDNFRYEVSVWEEPYKDLYIKGFIDGMLYRPSCYKCHFACPTRVSDMTIGDFWGLSNAESLPKESKDGISLMLPITEKGIGLVDAIKNNLSIYERSVEEAVKGNTQLRHPSIQGNRSRLFNLLYPILPFDIAMRIVVTGLK